MVVVVVVVVGVVVVVVGKCHVSENWKEGRKRGCADGGAAQPGSLVDFFF